MAGVPQEKALPNLEDIKVVDPSMVQDDKDAFINPTSFDSDF